MDGGAIRWAEAQMAATRQHDRTGLFRDSELNTGRAGRSAIVRTRPAAKIDDLYQSERPQNRIVE
jgi:hypothetical protein